MDRECWNSAVLGTSWVCSTKGTSEDSCNALGLSRWAAWWTWVFDTWRVDFNLFRLSFNNSKKKKFGDSTLTFLPFVIFLLNNICLGKCDCVAPWHASEKRQLFPTGAWVCWSLVWNGWPCYCTVFRSACMSDKSQGDGRGLSGFLFLLHVTAEWFSSICLLWSRNSFGRKENKWLSLQSTKLSGALSLSSLVLHLTDLGRGKGRDALCAERSIYHLTGKNNSLEATYSRHPTMCQEECKIHTDISKPVAAAFLS